MSLPPRFVRTVLALGLCFACVPATSTPPPLANAPSDDPDDYDVDTSVEYRLEVGTARFIIPSNLLPAQAIPNLSNNTHVCSAGLTRRRPLWKSRRGPGARRLG